MLHRSMILAGLVVFASATIAGAQSQSGKVFARYNKPLKSVTLDLATGTLTRGPVVSHRVGTTIVDFNNNDLGGFVGVDTGNGFCEWFEAGVKGFQGNASDLMNDVVFAYCSAKADVASGGPGGSVKLGFYEGYTTFGGAPTTTVAAFTLNGLPANTGSSSFFGGFSCFFIRVIFGTLVAFSDGPIGYSWKFIDVGTDGTLGGTWPFLSCVVSCSGAILQVDGQGMEDAIDEYCPPGFLRATFTFGTTSGSFTSVSMDIREVKDQLGSETNFNASSTPNPDTLSVPWPPPPAPQFATIGRYYQYRIVRGTPSPPGSFNVLIRSNRVPLPNGVQGPAPLPVGAGGRILISGPLLAVQSGSHNGTTGLTASQLIPLSINLVGVHFAAQATVVGGGVRVSSGTEGTVGVQ